MAEKTYYQMPVEDVLSSLESKADGLTSKEASDRLSRYGRNELSRGKKVSPIVKFLLQFKDVFMIVLLIAAALSFIIGSFSDGIIMLPFVIIGKPPI